MPDRKYKILKIKEEYDLLANNDFWENIPAITIKDYLWMKNNYRPKVFAKVCYSEDYLFVYFKAYEDEITARFVKTNDPVHKDSCVEFFVNLFSGKSAEYFNFEVNAIGTMHAGFGAPGKRFALPVDEIAKIKIVSSIKAPVKGKYGSNNWQVCYKIPVSLFEKYYRINFNKENAKGNFYKCGDETKYEHYGVWNLVHSKKINFHLPKDFGDLSFNK